MEVSESRGNGADSHPVGVLFLLLSRNKREIREEESALMSITAILSRCH